MANKQLLFTFEDLSDQSKAIKALKRTFGRAGAEIVQVDVSPIKRSSGISYKVVTATFADSQTLALKVKQSGDIYEADLNGKQVPIKAQDDHPKAVAEIVKLMNAGRSKFQEKLAKALAKLPPTIRTAAPKLEAVLDQKIADLTEAIGAAKEVYASLTGTAAA
jgi:hypothetical protein